MQPVDRFCTVDCRAAEIRSGPTKEGRARTRSDKPCRSPAVGGKKRCGMHGGAPGSGAPRGNKNALKHGLCTRHAIAQRRHTQPDLKD